MAQIIIIILAIPSWISLFYIILNRKKEFNQNLSILTTIPLYLFSLVPLGVFLGFYLSEKKIVIDSIKDYKYSKKVRTNGNLIAIISIASTIFSIINLIQ